MAISPFDHPLLSGLLGDAQVARAFSVDADLAAMLRFEVALAQAEAEEGVIPAESAEAIAAALRDFRPDFEVLKRGVAHDGVVGVALVTALRDAVGGQHGRYVHFGATSQDVIDTSLALRLLTLLDGFDRRLEDLATALAAIEARDGDVAVMAHTRMQAALPVTAARKLRAWRDPLDRHRLRLEAVRADVAVLHFGGAAGTLEKLGDNAAAVSRRLAASLGLRAVPNALHSERDWVAALASWLSLVTGSLGKMGVDIALMAQTELGEVKLASGGGSSAMPHKANPVGAEMLVTLARFNATLLAGVHQSLVHENERSGAAWTLEWMLLPQMMAATGTALRTAQGLVEGLEFARKG